MNAKNILFTLVLSCIPFTAFTANLKDDVPSPKTKLEEFSAKTGVVIVRGFQKIGDATGLYNTSIEVEAKEFINVSSGKKEYGITVKVKKEDGRYDKDNTSYIDFDEVESLISGIDYISKVDKGATNFENFQADYSTKGDLKVSTFSIDNKIMVAIASGRIGSVTAYFNMSSLPEIRSLIQNAKAKIDILRK